MRPRAAALVLPLAVLVAGCGGEGVDERTLIPKGSGAQLEAAVERARDRSAAGNCSAARQAIRQGEREVRGLERLDRDLRQNLLDWFAHLDEQVNSDCDRGEEDEPTRTTTPETTTTETTPETTATPTPEPTATPTPTPEPTPEPTPTPTPDAGPGNGNGNGNGKGKGNNGNGNGNGGASDELESGG